MLTNNVLFIVSYCISIPAILTLELIKAELLLLKNLSLNSKNKSVNIDIRKTLIRNP